nr:MAG TPA: hypothetical protein [Caudoviricetes sp.]
MYTRFVQKIRKRFAVLARRFSCAHFWEVVLMHSIRSPCVFISKA